MKKTRVSKTAQVNLLMLANLGIPEAVHFQEVLQFSNSALSSLQHLPMASKLPICISLLAEILYQRTNEILVEKDNPLVLDLACGYSPRVLRICDSTHTYIGVDLSDVVETLTKYRNELTGHIEHTHDGYYSVDLTKYDEMVALTDKLQAPVSVVTQALLTYLTIEQKQVLMENIKNLLKKNGGCWIIPDAATNHLLPDLFSAVLGSEAYSIYKQVMKIVDMAVKRDRSKNGWQTTDEMCDALEKNGFQVERVPLYTDTLNLRSLDLVSPEKAEEIIDNWKKTSALIVTAN